MSFLSGVFASLPSGLPNAAARNSEGKICPCWVRAVSSTSKTGMPAGTETTVVRMLSAGRMSPGSCASHSTCWQPDSPKLRSCSSFSSTPAGMLTAFDRSTSRWPIRQITVAVTGVVVEWFLRVTRNRTALSSAMVSRSDSRFETESCGEFASTAAVAARLRIDSRGVAARRWWMACQRVESVACHPWRRPSCSTTRLRVLEDSASVPDKAVRIAVASSLPPRSACCWRMLVSSDLRLVSERTSGSSRSHLSSAPARRIFTWEVLGNLLISVSKVCFIESITG